MKVLIGLERIFGYDTAFKQGPCPVATGLLSIKSMAYKGMADVIKMDIDELLAVAKATLEFLREQKWSKPTPLAILDRLVSETRVLIHDGVALDRCQFDSSSIGEWFDRDRSKKDENRKWLKGHLDSYESYVQENQQAIDTYLKEAGCRARLKIDSTGSTGGERNYYYLGLCPFDTLLDQPLSQPNSVPEGGIRYQLRQMPKLNPLARPFGHLDLEGYSLWLYFAPGASIGAATLFLWFDILVVRNYSHWPYLVLLALVVWLFWGTLVSLYGLLDRRVSIAPGWMVPWKVHCAQLEMVPSERCRSNGYPIRFIRLVRYGADCGICGAPIEIVKGRRQFAGRLIGQCNESGVEHIYSFDHVSKIGMPLRSNGYYGRSDKQYGEFYRQVTEE